MDEKTKQLRLKEIDSEIERFQQQILEINASWDFSSKSYEEFFKTISDERNMIDSLSREKRFLMPYTLTELDPEDGHIMTIEEFIESVKEGYFCDDDGYGKYIQGNMISNIRIYPSDVEFNNIRPEFDKIRWYNK